LLAFRSIEAEDKDKMKSYLSKRPSDVTEASFATYFLWDEKFKFEICFIGGFLLVRFQRDGETHYMAPVGEGDFTAAVEEIINHCREHGEPLVFSFLTDEYVREIGEAFPGMFEFIPDRDSADYIYSSEKLIKLSGKKLHSKRNHINRFMREFEGRWLFEPVRQENLCEVFEYENRWRRDNRTSEGDLEVEKLVIKKLLINMDFLGAVGGLLRLDGQIIGFSIGTEISKETFDVLIEKADWYVPGAYQVLNNEFAKAYCSGYKYVNREEDMGIEGLRKAKLSYYPEKIIMKHVGLYKGASSRVADRLRS
jgi:hypothetical protein